MDSLAKSNLLNVRLPASRRKAVKSEAKLEGDSEPHLSLMANVDYDLLPHQLGFWIRRAQIAVMQSYEEHIADLDLRPVEAAALILVGKNTDISQIVLGSALGTDQSTMVAICTRLEKRGFIERRRLPEDRRYQLLGLTAEGRKAASRVRRRPSKHNEKLLETLSQAERQQLLTMLQALIKD